MLGAGRRSWAPEEADEPSVWLSLARPVTTPSPSQKRPFPTRAETRLRAHRLRISKRRSAAERLINRPKRRRPRPGLRARPPRAPPRLGKVHQTGRGRAACGARAGRGTGRGHHRRWRPGAAPLLERPPLGIVKAPTRGGRDRPGNLNRRRNLSSRPLPPRRLPGGCLVPVAAVSHGASVGRRNERLDGAWGGARRRPPC